MTPARRAPRQAAAASPALLERINRNAAGIDCGAETHYVAVPPDRAASAGARFWHLHAACTRWRTGWGSVR